jgi:serine/threonine protein kinase HipA of HipAB toxin-antitoxin module
MGMLELRNKVKNMTDDELRAEFARINKLDESVDYKTSENNKWKARRYYNLVGVELLRRENSKND